jgi:hypothetical protein
MMTHPRLYFTPAELHELRALRNHGVHAHIWRNLAASADWCMAKTPRLEWIAPIEPDPIYLNLYDRFFAMMHDMAVMEHLAFAYAYSGEKQYSDGARQWVLSCCRIWKREAEGEPDANKAYAVMRLLKGLAVGYDLLFDEFTEDEKAEVRGVLLEVGGKYYEWFLQNPGMAGPDQDRHHGSVEASSFGVAALVLLGEVPEASNWLDLMVRKHTEYLLPHALTPSGTQEQSSNYWASTMQYRLFFMDALRRVTGQDLFKEYSPFMDGRIALAAIAGPYEGEYGEDQQSILFASSYGQLNYWSPVLLYLAREYRRPIYQYLALWDSSLGAMEKTSLVTSNGEQLLFSLGGYAYAWYDPTVAAHIEENLPLSFEFPGCIRWEDGSTHTEVYARASYEVGAIAIAMRLGCLIVHAGGRPVLIDPYDFQHEPPLVADVTLTDDGTRAIIQCTGAAGSNYSRQTVELQRPGGVAITRQINQDVRWWCHGQPTRQGNQLTWPDGTTLTVMKGSIASFEPEGHYSEKVVGMGKLKLVDPRPIRYPLITARPYDSELVVKIEIPIGSV